MKLEKLGPKWLLPILFPLAYVLNFLLAWPVTYWSGIANPPTHPFWDYSFLAQWSIGCRLDLSFPNILDVYPQLEALQASGSCGHFGYGMPLLMLLSLVDVNLENYFALALVTGLFLSLVLGLFLSRVYNLTWKQQVLVFFVVFSPGTYLLFERGNFDQIIFLLVLGAAALFARSRFFASISLLTLATVTKFYTLPLLLFQLLLARTVANRILAGGFFALGTAWVLAEVNRGEFLPEQGSLQFGFPVLNHYFEWLGLSLAPLPNVIAIVSPLLIWFSLVVIQRLGATQRLARWESTVNALAGDYVFQFMGILFVGMFFVGLSYDYRLLFLAVAGISLIVRGNWSRFEKWVLWLSLMVALWGSSALGNSLSVIPLEIKPYLIGGFQLFGDLMGFVWVGILMHFGSMVVATKLNWFHRILGFVSGASRSSKGR